MANQKDVPAKKKLVARSRGKTAESLSGKKKKENVENSELVTGRIYYIVYKLKKRQQDFLNRRSHRSLRLTRRRDYSRKLSLPGYLLFTLQVNRIIKQNWKIFLPIVLIYSAIMMSVGLITSQETYDAVGGLVAESTNDLVGNGFAKLGQAGLMVVSAFTIDPLSLSASQQVYLIVSMLFAWLTTVWLLREILMKRHPRLRDGLYNAGAPILSTILVTLVLFVQLLPVGVMTLLYTGLESVDFMNSGFGRMLFSVLAIVVLAMVLYWVTSTIVALVVVTLPGMYPLRAIAIAGDLIVGRRLRVMYRLLWGAAYTFSVWLIVMMVMVLLERWMVSWWSWLSNVPVVPIVGAVMVSWATVWLATYVYLLYRRIVDNGKTSA